MDEVQRWNEVHLDVSLRNHRAKVEAERVAAEGFDGLHCIDCDNDIEPPRVKLKLLRCSACAHDKEREDAARRRNGSTQ